jgi:hypothetical protein
MMGSNTLRDQVGFILIGSHFSALLLCMASIYVHGVTGALQIAFYLTPLSAYYMYAVLKRFGEDALYIDAGTLVRSSYATLAISIVVIFGVFMNVAVFAFATGLISGVDTASQLVGGIETALAVYMAWLVGDLFDSSNDRGRTILDRLAAEESE